MSVDATINRAHQVATNTTGPDEDRGLGSNYTNMALQGEPAVHAIDRSRSGLTTKVQTAVDGNGRPPAVVVTGGRCNDRRCWLVC